MTSLKPAGSVKVSISKVQAAENPLASPASVGHFRSGILDSAGAAGVITVLHVLTVRTAVNLPPGLRCDIVQLPAWP